MVVLYTGNPPKGCWVDTWTCMPQLTEPANLPPPPYNGSTAIFGNSSIRQTIKISTGASQIRLRLSNAFGTTNLPITAATIALPVAYSGRNFTGSSGINKTTVRPLTFSGNQSISIPNGALAVSDPLAFALKAGQVLSITIYLADGQQGNAITSHPGSRTQSWIAHGDHTTSSNMTDPSATSVFHWYFISALEAWQPAEYGALAIVGDSITDGRGSDNNGNSRWPDLLFSRLQRESMLGDLLQKISIANQAAGGNRILADGLGPSALSRIERDVLAQSGVRYALIFEGVNDIGVAGSDSTNQTAIYNALIQAYQQMITRIHARGIAVFGATITPFGCMNTTLQPYATPEREATRLKVNTWIRKSIGMAGGFDAIVDFDAIARNPRNATQLNPLYDLGDCLHMSPVGYRALADGFPLDVFRQFEHGVSAFM
ncbi:uncharacterized protein MYCFIDRAFT_77321 [Pseudocercospora fijiensis CIRAD86]|uniref:Uncharacterized protein n=1 Tax=Pseudocercospora fijiensis (strain CIRAD86) TaxID=383855 RepID=M2ZAM9_PSEFD|nr:uncharacterized protein MYCFIDRAFT_77321 [Pseudocercospora fijiensis CIRAD86]EME86875.1 hypothetical protein MYCFIDRAFT_77321 [Pseudocercospora fijiensis CIRAD86]